MIRVTDHAIERYVDRVKPCLTIDQAREEVRRLFETVVGFSKAPPYWHAQGRERTPFELYAMVGDGIAFGIKDGLAITCLTRGGYSDEVREAQNTRKAAKRTVKRAKRYKGRDRFQTLQDRAGQPRRKDWDAAA